MPEGVGYGPQNTAATGLNLNVIGGHAYAYNSTAASTSAFEILSFQTGNYYVKGWIQFNGFVQPSNPGTGTAGTLDVAFNGITVIILKTETELETSSPHSVRCPIIIPPLTTVTASIDASANESAMFATVIISSKLYGKVD
jgi:hypothetical protein